ncbi:MAG: hydroxymethylbilane synthase [Actinomycetia bacterium]|nr:hydroxymethylbilane synthase [Actinomycetes bacterium]MCP3913460.1 hydroxymethylbilane synthase [Actinomycetes bacterium]MCP4086045.1 hydroxymethylbilane synthase [Actinomycetes bacterium]
MTDPRAVRAATRSSPLALYQTDLIAELVAAAHPGRDVTVVEVTTDADKRLDIPIWEMGGKGVFVKQVQALVLAGEADIAVHSAKDLPSETPPGLVIAAVPARADARDALVGTTLADLPTGARVATGSVRRRTQLQWLRPDLSFTGLRGNIATRLAQASDFDAIVMAAAALDRLELGIEADILAPDVMVPQVGQGTLAVECRADDHELIEVLGAIDHRRTHRVLDAERGFLCELGGDCDLPAGAYAVIDGEDEAPITIEGLLASLDGHRVLRATRTGGDDEQLGRDLARYLLDDAGGSSLLAS